MAFENHTLHDFTNYFLLSVRHQYYGQVQEINMFMCAFQEQNIVSKLHDCKGFLKVQDTVINYEAWCYAY